MKLKGVPAHVTERVRATHENFHGDPDFTGSLSLKINYVRGKLEAWSVQVMEHGRVDIPTPVPVSSST